MDDDQLTLWFGDRLLGRIHLREARTETWITGVLLPTSDEVRLWGLRQWQSDIFPGRPVIQRRLPAERLWDGGEDKLDETEGPRSTVIPARVFMNGAFGVPHDEQLSIHDSVGQNVSVVAISLREVKVGTETAPRFSWAVPQEALHHGSVWMVSATCAPPPEGQ
jgi:hypothetical protein